MATQQATVRTPFGIPRPGVYFTDCDHSNLYRVESVHRKEGIVFEDCRSLSLLMLTFKEFRQMGFKELDA